MNYIISMVGGPPKGGGLTSAVTFRGEIDELKRSLWTGSWIIAHLLQEHFIRRSIRDSRSDCTGAAGE